MNKNMKRAFTITELVIVIAVVAILAAVLIPTFSNLIEKANVSNDTVLVRNLNEALIIAETTEGKPATMHDALTAVAEQGYTVEKLTPRSTGDILWEQTSNRFALVKDNEIVFGDDTTTAEIGYTYWKITSDLEEVSTGEYSYYLADEVDESALTEALAVSTGLDVGNNSNIAINYNNANDAQNVIIRTQGGKLSINGSKDTVSHYGTANSVEITAIAGNSYHEYGTILGNISLEQGRVVLENKSEVSSVVVTATSLTGIAIEDKSGNNTTVAATDSTVASELKGVVTGTTNVFETAANEEEMSLFAGGIGTESSPYLIATAEQFKNIDSIVADGNYYFEQVEDLVLSSPVNYFKGVYDGGNHSIMAGYKSYNYIFYKMIGHATFKNIELVQSTEHATSLLCIADWGTTYGADFENITISGTKTSVKAGNFGFIVINALYTQGEADGAIVYNFKNITNNVELINEGASTGVFIGSGPCFNTYATINFENCVNNAKVSGMQNVGFLYGNPSYIGSITEDGNGIISVVNCKNNDTICSLTTEYYNIAFAPGYDALNEEWQYKCGGTYTQESYLSDKDFYVEQNESSYSISLDGSDGVTFQIAFNINLLDHGDGNYSNTTKYFYDIAINSSITSSNVLTHKAVDLEKAKEIFGADYKFEYDSNGIAKVVKDDTMYFVFRDKTIGRNPETSNPGETGVVVYIYAYDSTGTCIGAQKVK